MAVYTKGGSDSYGIPPRRDILEFAPTREVELKERRNG